MEKSKVTQLAGLGALGAAVGLIVLFVLFAWLWRPTTTGGVNASTAMVTWISVGGIFVALAIVHLVFGRVLVNEARRWRARS